MQQIKLDRREFLVSASMVAGGMVLGIRWADAQSRPLSGAPWAGDSANGHELSPWIEIAQRRYRDHSRANARDRQWLDDAGRDECHRGTGVRLVAGQSRVQLDSPRSHGEGRLQRRVPALLRRARDRFDAHEARFAARRQRARAPEGGGGGSMECPGCADRGQGQRADSRAERTNACAMAKSLPKPRRSYLPAEPALKPQSEWTFLGKASPTRLHVPEVVTGKTTFGIDVKVPGMVHAALKQSPVHGGKLKSHKPEAVLGMPGVRAVVVIDPAKTKGSRPTEQSDLAVGELARAERSRRDRRPLLASEEGARRIAGRMGRRSGRAMDERRADLRCGRVRYTIRAAAACCARPATLKPSRTARPSSAAIRRRTAKTPRWSR